MRNPARIVAPRGRAAWSLLLVASAIVAGAAIAYLLRQPDAKPPQVTAAEPSPTVAPAARQSAPVASLVEPLARRLADNPDDPAGWTLLAQSYDYMGQPGKAAEAYRQAIAHGNDDPAISAALTAAENAFISQTLLGAGQAGGGAQALPPDHPVTPSAPAMGAARPAAPATPASGATVRGTVRVAAALADRVRPEDTVFIYAHATGGPPMPLAVLRASAAALPLDFVLDDSTAMTAGRGLSSADRVTVVARISKSGAAVRRPGDLIGESRPLDPRAGEPLSLLIDSVVPAGP